jgi:transcriptional regulator with XRE-family HTH domain
VAIAVRDKPVGDGAFPVASTRFSGGDPEAFGAFLRRARERSGLTLDQIAKETRIPWRHLDALERGNLAATPGEFYRRAEIRAYAAAVHLDQNLALECLQRALAPPAPTEPIAKSRPPEAPGLRRQVLMAIGVAGAAALLGLAAWSRGLASEGRRPSPGPIPSHELPSAAFAPLNAPGPSPLLALRVPLVEATSSADSSSSADETLEGELVVTTEPPGGRVTVDGIGWGDSPVTIRSLSLGARRVRVTKDGYASEDRVVRLTKETPSFTLLIPLRTAP